MGLSGTTLPQAAIPTRLISLPLGDEPGHRLVEITRPMHTRRNPVDLQRTGARGYLGLDRQAWREYDACILIKDGARLPSLLVDNGDADGFLEEQLKTSLLKDACAEAGMPANIRLQKGYDHSYFFISTFMAEHVAWHAARLKT